MRQQEWRRHRRERDIRKELLNPRIKINFSGSANPNTTGAVNVSVIDPIRYAVVAVAASRSTSADPTSATPTRRRLRAAPRTLVIPEPRCLHVCDMPKIVSADPNTGPKRSV